jgi:hypothetical protein
MQVLPSVRTPSRAISINACGQLFVDLRIQVSTLRGMIRRVKAINDVQDETSGSHRRDWLSPWNLKGNYRLGNCQVCFRISVIATSVESSKDMGVREYRRAGFQGQLCEAHCLSISLRSGHISLHPVV